MNFLKKHTKLLIRSTVYTTVSILIILIIQPGLFFLPYLFIQEKIQNSREKYEFEKFNAREKIIQETKVKDLEDRRLKRIASDKEYAEKRAKCPSETRICKNGKLPAVDPRDFCVTYVCREDLLPKMHCPGPSGSGAKGSQGVGAEDACR